MHQNLAGLLASYPTHRKQHTENATTGEELPYSDFDTLVTGIARRAMSEHRASYDLGCFITPKRTVEQFADSYPQFAFYHGQPSQSLSERANDAFAVLFGIHRAAKAIVITHALPQIDTYVLNHAFLALGTSDIVLGPTTERSIYLIGMKREHSLLFDCTKQGPELDSASWISAVKSNRLSYTLLDTLNP